LLQKYKGAGSEMREAGARSAGSACQNYAPQRVEWKRRPPGRKGRKRAQNQEKVRRDGARIKRAHQPRLGEYNVEKMVERPNW